MRQLVIDTFPVFEPLLTSARYKGIHGGRGSGKSHFFAESAIEESLKAKKDIVCLRETQKSLEFSVKKLIESKIESMGVGDYFEVQDKRIISKRGGVIIFTGMQNHTADSIKSLEGFDIAWFEEAQNMSQKSLELLRPTIRKEDKEKGTYSEMWFSWNPNQETDPIDVFLRQNTPPDSVVVEANFMDNPRFPDILRADMEYDRSRDVGKYNHIWLGEYQENSEACVFKNWTIEEFDSPVEGVYRLGADWGFANDPTVLVRARLDGHRLYIDYEAHMIGCEIDQTPDLFDLVPASRKWFITADCSRPETISYMNKHGYPKIRPRAGGALALIKEGIEWLKNYDIVVHPRCVYTIAELKNYKWKVDKLTDAILPILEDKHNHVIDALRYACEGARKAQAQGKPMPTIAPWRPTNSSMGYMG